MARTVAQVREEIRSRAEGCMSDKKNDGFLNQLLSNPEKWRGQCEEYARRDMAKELREAEEREAKTKIAVDDAITKKAGAVGSSKNIYIIIGACILALVLFFIF